MRANGARQIVHLATSPIWSSATSSTSRPTCRPTTPGVSDLSGIRKLIDQVAGALGPEAVLVVLCQVPPGFTRALTSVPHDRLYYQVETLVFGRAVERATEPERYIVGCADPAKPIDPRLRAVLEAFGCPILPMRYESAELAKISINMCLVASISVANTLAELCEAINADWSEIVPSLRLDRRIGQYSYLVPGLGIAGGNLERDLATVIRLADQHGTDAGVVRAWQANSRRRRDWAARAIRRMLVDQQARRDDRCVGARLQGEHPLGEELAVDRDAAAAARGAACACTIPWSRPISRTTPMRTASMTRSARSTGPMR